MQAKREHFPGNAEVRATVATKAVLHHLRHVLPARALWDSLYRGVTTNLLVRLPSKS